MPNRTGLDATRAIKAGAEGYLIKNLGEREFADLVGQIGRGEPVMSPGLAKKLLREFARLKESARRADEEAGLTERERGVLEQVAGGATNREIGAALFISENTVNFHVKNILGKLHMRNRVEVVAWAVERGLVHRELG